MNRESKRSGMIRLARIDFMRTLADFGDRHSWLSYIELAQFHEQELASCLKFALRVERHGNDQEPADA